MAAQRIIIVMFALAIASLNCPLVLAETWQLEQDQQWKPVPAADADRYALIVARTEKLVNTGSKAALAEQWNLLRKQFPEIKESDMNTFIKAELFFCEKKYMKAARRYETFLEKSYSDSPLYQLAIERHFHIADALLAGRKVAILWLFKTTAYGQGVKMMEKISERAVDKPIGLEAALKAAKYYEKRGKYNEAYTKWSEIQWQWSTDPIAKDALLAMARCKHALYIGPKNDASCLDSAKTYYQEFTARYPEDAENLKVNQILEQIDEQMAYKQFTIGWYYQRTGKLQSANLYYNMVVSNWSQTSAAELARQKLEQNTIGGQTNK